MEFDVREYICWSFDGVLVFFCGVVNECEVLLWWVGSGDGNRWGCEKRGGWGGGERVDGWRKRKEVKREGGGVVLFGGEGDRVFVWFVGCEF